MVVLIVFLAGLLFGSFLTCVTYRLPRNLSFYKGRSICTHCKSAIRFYDNIPVISFLLLGGKCRNCKKPISVRYPLIELAAGLLFSFFYLLYTNCQTYFCSIVGNDILGLIFMFFVIFIVLGVFITDLEGQIIPDQLVLGGFCVSAFIFLMSDGSFLIRMFSAFTAAGLLLFLHLATRGRGMGLGDVKFALFGGLFFDIQGVLLWLMLSFLVGGIFGIVLLVLGKTKFGAKIAFGPFMAIAFFVMMVFGDKISFNF